MKRVLIVGGGLGGLTLAAALHQRDFDVEVVEREATWPASGAGLSVQPNGLRVLRRLGLDGAVIEGGIVVGHWLFVDQAGDVLCDNDLTDVWADVGPCVGIARPCLQEVLVEGASAVPCRLGTSVMTIHEQTHRVEVGFTDGSTGAYDLVVGADGIRSMVRSLVFGLVEPTFAGQMTWRSVASFRLPGPPSIQFWLGDDRCFFGLCSVGENKTYGFGYVTQEREHDPLDGRLERVRKRFSKFGPAVQDYLRSLDDDEQLHCSTIEWVEHVQWHTNRVALIGDAAHASSPMMGQGGSGNRVVPV